MSRNHRIINIQYPELVQALTNQTADNFIIDGEIIAIGANNISDFQLLQSRINITSMQEIHQRSQQIRITYCLFDVMYAGGYNLTNIPLLTRKKILRRLLQFNTLLHYTNHKSPDGLKYYQAACKRGDEGIIAKDAKSLYVSQRAPTWLKFKCGMEQELVIGGYTQPRGSRTDLGALLVGYYQGKKLIYAGKVGSGFSHETLALLGKKLRSREIKTCPFDNYEGPATGVHWVKPELVAEFKFAQWTQGNKLRVPRYKGLRTDKAAHLVVKEA
jgi:bifunctional non-homologous end joining protein LigD